MLGDVHKGDGEIARRMQDRQPERAHQHDVAGVSAPSCQSKIAQASNAMVSTTVTPA